MFGTQFYPTSLSTGLKMLNKVDLKTVSTVLDPSAGKGDLLRAFTLARYFPGYGQWFDKEHGIYSSRPIKINEGVDLQGLLDTCEDFSEDLRKSINSNKKNLWAIELDPDLQAVLRGRGYKVIGQDFLSFDGMDQPDLILANFPFASGATHLLRAMDYLYSGQIVALINAETIKNPYTRERQDLCDRLTKCGASIEFMQEEFVDAERTTKVEVAMVYIDQRRAAENTAFEDMVTADDSAFGSNIEGESALVSHDRIEAIVQRYKATRNRGVELIRNTVGASKDLPFIALHVAGEIIDDKRRTDESLKRAVTAFLSDLRKHTWQQMMNDPALHRFLTSEAKARYLSAIETYSTMDVTIENVRSLVAEISAGYQGSLSKAVVETFDKLSRQYACVPETAKNRYLYDTWRSNSAYKVNRKVVVPSIYAFTQWKSWLCGRYGDAVGFFDDLDKVCSYFDGGRTDYQSTLDTIARAMQNGQSSKIKSTYFTVTVYQKGTAHITFNDLDILRRFNVFVGKQKNWLGREYGAKDFKDMSKEEQSDVQAFEGESQYRVDPLTDPFSKPAGIAREQDQSLLAIAA